MKKWLSNMKKETYVKAVIVALGILIFGWVLHYANTDLPGQMRHMPRMDFERARVLAIIEDQTVVDEAFEAVRRGNMVIELELLTGTYAGQIGQVSYHVSPLFQVTATEGDVLSVRVGRVTNTSFDVLVHNHERTLLLVGLVVVFFLALSLIGGKKGFQAVLSLAFTLVSIVFLLIPLLVRGYNAITVTIGILAVVTVISLLLIGGFTKKSAVAIIGCMSGVVFAAMLATFSGHVAGISGFNMEEAEALLSISMDTELQISGLFISGILIASLGAVMDISMTIASAAEEIVTANRKITSKELFKSSMNVGRDAMGTMSNTLILAFIGTGLNMIIMIFAYGVTFNQFINTDLIAIEIIRSLSGSLGIVLTVPIVAYVASKMMMTESGTIKKRKK
ncbi:MAG: YibE/F family protein [Turicibacter sp.]|nr:YibE/F family protein [Turicibacter sp.]